MITVYTAKKGSEKRLENELGAFETYGSLRIVRDKKIQARWSQNTWNNAVILRFSSIGEAAKLLLSMGKLWCHHPTASIRRAALIEQKLPFFSPKPLQFPSFPPKTPFGMWTLLDDTTLLLSTSLSSPFPGGVPHFIESEIPPSRAYLKLYEALTLFGEMPQKNETCLEVGAAPGSWTWAIQQLQASIIAVDKAPLAPSIAADEKTVTLKKDAFTLLPEDFPDVTWLFSDVICYPETLLEWVKKWIAVKPHLRCICTLKFKENADYSIADAFAKLPSSKIVYLYHNKHELTWMRSPSFI